MCLVLQVTVSSCPLKVLMKSSSCSLCALRSGLWSEDREDVWCLHAPLTWSVSVCLIRTASSWDLLFRGRSCWQRNHEIRPDTPSLYRQQVTCPPAETLGHYWDGQISRIWQLLEVRGQTRSGLRPGPHTVDIILCPLLADWIQSWRELMWCGSSLWD